MRSFFVIFAIMALTVLFTGPSEAASVLHPQKSISISGTGLVQKVYHRCYPSRCWCRGKRTICTRDCRRDRHCRWIPSKDNRCGKVWRCYKVKRPDYKCRRCLRKAKIRRRLCLKKAKNFYQRRKCRIKYYRQVRTCKRRICR